MIADVLTVSVFVAFCGFVGWGFWIDRAELVRGWVDARNAWREANPKTRRHPRRTHGGKGGRAF